MARAYSPREWDRICKGRQTMKYNEWVRLQSDAAELYYLTKETGGSCYSQDMAIVRRMQAKPEPRVARSSFTGQMESQSFPQDLADLRTLPVRPASQDPETDSELTQRRLRTYRRLMNARKAYRRHIRASGGRA